MMSRRIKDTPGLTGDDAREFVRQSIENESKTVSDEEFRAIMNADKLIKWEENTLPVKRWEK